MFSHLQWEMHVANFEIWSLAYCCEIKKLDDIYGSVDHTCNLCSITSTIVYRNKDLASVVSVYTHAYVIAV